MVSLRPLRILDFDIENRPLSYLGSDFTTSEITAIAWAFTDKPKQVRSWVLEIGGVAPDEGLRLFLAAYNAADIVTGHYILGHDLPIINGALLEYGMEPLGDKLVSDTKVDLVSRKGVSASQESIGGMLQLMSPKEHMDQYIWRQSNRLTPWGVRETKRRVIGDVRQHMEMRARLVELGWLKPPRPWAHGQGGAPAYTP